MLVDGNPWLGNLKTSEKFLSQSDLNFKTKLNFSLMYQTGKLDTLQERVLRAAFNSTSDILDTLLRAES